MTEALNTVTMRKQIINKKGLPTDVKQPLKMF